LGRARNEAGPNPQRTGHCGRSAGTLVVVSLMKIIEKNAFDVESPSGWIGEEYMNGRRSFITDCVKYAPAQLVPAFVGLVSIPILTRLFAPGDYGQYVLVMATISVLTVLGNWLSTAIVRFYPACENDHRLNELYSSVIISLIISLLFLGGLFVIAVHISFGDLRHFMIIGAIVFALTSTIEVFQGFLQAKRRAIWYSLISVWRTAAGLAFGIALVTLFGFGIEGLLWGSALSMALVLPLLWKAAMKEFSRMSRLSSNLIKEMARFSFPLVAANLAAWILSLSDRYIIELFRGAHEVGIYSASYAISEKGIFMLVSFFLMASRPISMTLWEKEGAHEARYFISLVTRYYLLVCVPAVVGLSVLAQPIMSIIAREEYLEGFRIIPFVALGGLLLGLQQRYQEGLIYFNKTSFVMVAIVVGAGANVGLNLLFVPKYGYIVAALTTLIGYAILLAMMVVISRRFFTWKFPFVSLGRSVLASAVMAIAAYVVSNGLTSYPLLNLVAAVLLGTLSYSCMLYLVGEIQPNEKKALKAVITRLAPSLQFPRIWRR
jgi:O-antigen/teichoic acid export membrane protein